MTPNPAAIARRRVSHHPGCEFDDLHQIAQIAAWQYPERVAGAAAKRDIIDYIRKQTHARNRLTIPHRALEWQERQSDDHHARLLVERALSALPFRWQTAIRLRYWHGHTLAEVGRMLGCGEARAFQLVRDSLERMREVLA